MTIRRDISLGIQNYVGSIILRDSTVKKDKYHRRGESYPADHEFMPYTMNWVAKQKRPYSDVYLIVYNQDSDEYWWSVGYSKCIGKVEDRLPDEWDPYEGLRLALARAATDIGKQIQKHEDGVVNSIVDAVDNVKIQIESDIPLPKPEEQKIATDVPAEEWAEGGQPLEVEIEGHEKFPTYTWHGMALVRVSDFPEHVDAINKFMVGQTRPFVNGADPNDYIYLHDFENFLAKGTLFWD